MFLSFIGKLIRPGTIWLMVGSSALYGGYELVRPTKTVYTVRQQYAINKLAEDVSVWAGELLIPRGKMVIQTFKRDPFGKVTDAVRQVLWQSDRFDILDYSAGEKLAKLTKWTRPSVVSRKDAVKIIRSREGDYVLWGTVQEFSDVNGVAQLLVDVELINGADANIIEVRHFAIEQESTIMGRLQSQAAGVASEAGISLPMRFLIWIILTLFLPIFTYPLARKLVTDDSNLVVFITLVGYTLVNVGMAYFLFAWGATSMVAGVLLLFSFAIALYYNWRVLDRIKELGNG